MGETLDEVFMTKKKTTAILTLVMEELFKADRKVLEDKLDVIVRKNNQLIGKDASGIHYNNNTLHSEALIFSLGYLVNPCHEDLEPLAESFTEQTDKLNSDYSRIRQTIVLLLRPAATMQEALDLLPDCLSRFVAKKLSTFKWTRERMQEELWRLSNQQILEYRQILPVIQMYSVAELLL